MLYKLQIAAAARHGGRRLRKEVKNLHKWFTPQPRKCHRARELLQRRVRCARTVRRLWVAPGAHRMCLPAGVTTVRNISFGVESWDFSNYDGCVFTCIRKAISTTKLVTTPKTKPRTPFATAEDPMSTSTCTRMARSECRPCWVTDDQKRMQCLCLS